MTPKTSHHETPDAAELRRLLSEATPRPWEAEGSQLWGPDGVLVAAVREHSTIVDRPDAHLIAAAVNSMESLLDALDVAEDGDEIAGRLAHLLCDLTGGRMSKTSYPVPVMEREIEQYLSECHESDLKDERDALSAAVKRVRELHRESHVKTLSPECAAEECDHEDDCPPVDYAACAECHDIGDQAHFAAYEEGGLERVAWPCPTIRAIGGE